MALDSPLRGILGPKDATLLEDAFGMHVVRNLLDHLPRRYTERGELTSLADLHVGEDVTVQARVTKVVGKKMKPIPGKKQRWWYRVTVTDGTRTIPMSFFNMGGLDRRLPVGTTALFAGRVERFNRELTLTNPEFHLDEEDEAFAGGLIPIYPSKTKPKVTTWLLRRLQRLAVDMIDDDLGDDPLPAALRARHRLPDLATAYRLVHRPADRAEAFRGRARLAWDEALVIQVELARRRAASRLVAATPRVAAADGLLDSFDATLPFALTDGQREVGRTLEVGIGRPYPMQRLLQGEVGSGKTIVALRAMLAVVDAGGQAALLAPTEVLAAQHVRSLRELLGPLGRAGELDSATQATRVAFLTGAVTGTARRAALAEIADGTAGLVVGTHALLEEAVAFHDLGLVVVDEQHRFGVEQRDALRGRGERPPHVLVMTATPIPRTVAMTVFGDLETSVLTELPAGRADVATHVVPASAPRWVSRMWERVRAEVEAERQVYVVCPRIGGGEQSTDEAPPDTGDADPDDGQEGRRPAAAVLEVLPELVTGELAGLRVAALHGRQSADEKDAVMRGFARGEIDVLVATTVVEVGVDVPNATAMVVLDADRFGISQLHQLRGRIGRGSHPGWCFLQTDVPEGAPAHERLSAVAATRDGMRLAELDLRSRREGDVLGAAQSGRRRSLRLLDLLRDGDLIQEARREATRLVEQDPDLTAHPALAGAIASLLDEEAAAYLEKG